ncbi:hypothetical protein AHAS_Ahas18G0144500 [Arachis hypogaea]
MTLKIEVEDGVFGIHEEEHVEEDAIGTFVEKNYKELKTLNPKLPILIRECSGDEPQLWARFDFGVEKGIKLEGLSEAQISKALEDLVKAGEILKA